MKRTTILALAAAAVFAIESVTFAAPAATVPPEQSGPPAGTNFETQEIGADRSAAAPPPPP